MPVDSQLIVRVMMRHRVRLLAFVGAIVGDRHLAEDVVQEVGARAIEHADTINDETHLTRWLRTSARLVAIEQMRTQRRQPLIFDDAVLDAIEARLDHLGDALPADMGEALDQCLAELSPYARRLVDCRYERGLTGHELADAMQRKHGTVYVALSRIHTTLGKCIRRRLDGATDA